MEIANTHLGPPWRVRGEKGFGREFKPCGFRMVFEEGKGNPEATDGFVALDITSLSLLPASSASSPTIYAGDEDVNAGDRASFKKTLCKKGLPPGGERRAFESAAADRERTAVLIDVASEDSNSSFPVKSPTAATVGSTRCRHLSSRRPSQWLHPRRVLLLSASLSSMGTLILLYFTVSMGKMTAGHVNAR